jgi:hypothetical protein
MDEPVTSAFSTPYYVRMTVGAIFLSSIAVRLLLACIGGNLANPIGTYGFTAFFLGLLYFYFNYFSRSWKRITVSADGIIVFNVVTRKQYTISYANISHIGTYRMDAGSINGGVFAQDFVIEFNGNRSLILNEDYYDNYKQLTMAIYLYKYGPGHGRERYLEKKAKSVN